MNSPTPDAKSIFGRGAEIPSPSERAAFLDEACAGHPAVRAEVEMLLKALGDAGSFMGSPAAPGGNTGAYDSPISEGEGTVIGPYTLREQIGEGGMGLVFVAEQFQPVRRKVALKVIKPGMDTRQVVARFEAERQALALMDHPNIAKVLDAGTTDTGRPFFVMELVRGVPITEYADANNLTPKDRLGLFVQVCQAVQHAHQKGIIHRDLKPSNVLVAPHDGIPVVKVIDFGVANALGQSLTEKTIYTRFAQMIGTPLYMSPEQAEVNQLDVDTRSDIYSLGVLLYELLTGTTPFDQERFRKAAFDEIRRIIKEEEPPRPSTRLTLLGATLTAVSAKRGTAPNRLAGLVRGELDWIVMKCLEKDRTRRYDTATALAKDVQRYLSGNSVEACPPTLGYRLRKAYHKNRTAVRVVSAFICLALGAAAMGVVLAVRATNAERAAAADRDTAIAQAKLAADNEREAVGNAKLARAEEAKVKAAQESLQANQYLWDMQMVPLALDSGTVAGLNQLLDRHVPANGARDRRSFEWYYWDRYLNSQVLSERLPDADDDYRSSWAVSEDGTRLARLTPPWRDGDRGRPQGARQDSPVLTVWDTTTRRKLLTHHMPISLPADQPDTSSPVGNGPRFSPDGRRVEVEWSYSVRGKIGGPGSGVVGPGGPNPIRPGKGLRQIVDIASDKVLLEPPLSGLSSEEGVDFSRDGRHFAWVSYPPGFGVGPRSKAIEVWSLESGKSITGPPTSHPYANIAFGPLVDEFVTANSVEVSEHAKSPAAVAGSLPLIPQVRISIRELSTGKEKRGWLVPGESLGNLTISPDGTLVAATVRGASVNVWEVATGKQLSTWKTGVPVNLLTFSPNSSRLEVLQSRPGRPLPGDASRHITILNSRTGVPFPPLEGVVMKSPLGANTFPRLNWSPDEKRVIAFNDNLIQTWDVGTGKPHLTFRGHVNPIVACGLTPDSKRVWSVERNGVFKEWDLNPLRPVEIPFLGGNEIMAAKFAASGDGARFAHLVGSSRKGDKATEFAVQLRDTAGKELKLLQPKPRIVGPQDFTYTSNGGVLLNRDGRRAVLTRSEDLSVRVGQAVPGEKEQQRLPAPDLTVWNSETGTELFHTPLQGARLFPAGINGHVSAISPDGRVVAIATEPAQEGDPVTVRMFDVDTMQVRQPLTLTGASGLFNLAFSPDGARLAAVAYLDDKSARRVSTIIAVWDATGGEPTASAELFRGMRSPIIGRAGLCRARIAWLPDSSRFALSHDSPLVSMLAIHDAVTGKAVVSLELPNTSYGTSPAVPTAIACSPDGRRVAALVITGRTRTAPEVKVWDSASGKELLTIRKTQNGTGRFGGGQPSNGSLLTFSGDGHRLLACEFGEATTWTPKDGGFGPNPAFILTTWDATPVPNRGER